MKLKTLEGYLQQLKGFEKPKIELEQYVTPPHIAAVALYTIQTQFEDLESSMVLDAGCGPGILGIGAEMLGASSVTAVDIDGDALKILRDNIDEMELTNIDVIQCDFLESKFCRVIKYFDTVLMNPPFGTKNNAGIDLKFLHMGILLSSNTVYSLHKSATRPHVQAKIKDWGMRGSVIAELRYNLPPTYKFHRKVSLDIGVDLWRVQHKT